MKADVVVDVGNSRIKWGRCTDGGITDSVPLPPDDAATWQQQLDQWRLVGPCAWVVTGVHPARRDRLAAWLRERGHKVQVLDQAAQLPLQVRVENPECVGIDRLLNAVAANARRGLGTRAAIIDAGSAVTVDYLDEAGAFQGGAILPGLHLMSQALHAYTALLPLVEVRGPVPPVGASTAAAMRAGIFWAVLGGIEALLRELRGLAGTDLEVYVTGGDGAVLAGQLSGPEQLWPEMTLEGIRLAAHHFAKPPTA
jgi:type III pantothenate kinase